MEIQVTINLNPDNAETLAAMLTTLKESGFRGQVAIIPPQQAETLTEQYKRATGKGKARLTADELKAVGWQGETCEAPLEYKERAMRLAIDHAEPVRVEAPEESQAEPLTVSVPVLMDDLDDDDF